MSGLRSRNKGKVGEREVATLIREYFPDIPVERSWQVRGGEGRPDVVAQGLGLHIEVKRGRLPNIRAAYRQACRDSAGSTLIPVAVTRADRDVWLVTLEFEDFLSMLQDARKG